MLSGLYEIMENDITREIFLAAISAFVPILIMVITLWVQKKLSDKQLKNEQQQFRATLMQNDNYYNSSLKLQEENNRVTQLPFLYLNQNIETGIRNENMFFNLEFVNLGNAVALDVKVEHESFDENNTWPCVCKRNMAEHEEFYCYSEFLSSNVLPVNGNASFAITLVVYEEGKEVSQDDKALAGEVHFKVTYKDTYYNQYEQEYMFQYWKSMGIGRVETYLPCVIQER